MDESPVMLPDWNGRTHHGNVVESVLLDLAAQRATGCLQVHNAASEEALVFLQDGLVYSAFVPGPRPPLGARLLSSGDIDADSLARALDVQRRELPGWRLGELLVHLGYVDFHVIEQFTSEQLRDMLSDLFGWSVTIWRFLPNKRTRQGVGAPVAVRHLLTAVRAGECQSEPPSHVFTFEVAAMLREFSTVDSPRTASTDADEVVEGTTDTAPVQPPKGSELAEAVDRYIRLETTDTVALLRELSVLQEEATPEPPPRSTRLARPGRTATHPLSPKAGPIATPPRDRTADKKQRRWLFAR